MLGFLGKVVGNLLAMLFAIALLIGGCTYVGRNAFQSAFEAARRAEANREQVAEQAPEPAESPVGKVFKSAANSFSKSVANDLIEQYEIVKDDADEMAKSIRAGAVAEMYLQAKDRGNYRRWKDISDGHQRKALGR